MGSSSSKRDSDGDMFPSKFSLFASRHEALRARHAEPGWYEWVFREFARYWYVLGVLAVAVFSLLQIVYVLIPASGPSATDLLVAALAVVAADGVVIAAGAYAYRFLWGKGGWVDRAVERHEEELARRAEEEKESAAPPAH